MLYVKFMQFSLLAISLILLKFTADIVYVINTRVVWPVMLTGIATVGHWQHCITLYYLLCLTRNMQV